MLTVDEGRKLGKRVLAEMTAGGDPAAQRSEDRRAMSVHQLCQTYLDAAAKGLVLDKRGQPPLLGNRNCRPQHAVGNARRQRQVEADDEKR
jgi:hypothetical protein